MSDFTNVLAVIRSGDIEKLRRMLLDFEGRPSDSVLQALLDAVSAGDLAVEPGVLRAIVEATNQLDSDISTMSRLRSLFLESIVHTDSTVRAIAAEGLGIVGRESDDFELVRALLDDDDSLVRVAALDALAALDPQRTRSILRGRLEHEEDGWVRAGSLAHAYMAGVVKTPPNLVALLDEGADVCGIFIRTVGELINNRVTMQTQRELRTACQELMAVEPPPFVRGSVEALLHQLDEGRRTR